MAIKAVLFDLDGTLLDTAPDFEVVLNRLRNEQGLGPIAAQRVRETVSNGARALVTLGFGLDEGDDGFEPLRQRLLELYSNHLAVETRPFPGIEKLLAFIGEHKLAWGIATNKPETYTTPIVEQLQLNPDCVICPDHVTQRKPHPESMHLAAKLIDCSTDEIVYVGDHLRDIECGKRADCITIAVRYGYIDADDSADSWGATHTVDHASEIPELLLQYL